MTTEIPLVEIAKLKDVLRLLHDARRDLTQDLEELHNRLSTATETSKESVEKQAALQEKVQGLERELESVRGHLSTVMSERDKARHQLSTARSERDKARRQLSSLRDRVERTIRQRTKDLYSVIERQDPFEQLELLRKGKRESDSRNATLSDENRKLQNSIRELRSRVEELEVSAEGYRSELESQAGQLERLNGLASRYKEEIAGHASRLEAVRGEAQRDILRDLIHQVTPRRLAELMDAIDDPTKGIAADQDTAKFVDWLIQYLRSIDVRITYRSGEQLAVREEDLHAIRLDEEYRAGSLLKVTTPGFSLGEKVLIRARVRYLEMEEKDGEHESGHDSTGEEMSGSAETSGTGGAGNLADDQEA
jgi:DNA repair exonuclease SbcCD ATPase subunit